ncbi:phosphate ABC transporter permease subunit PstC [Fictibacillus iocasae]|uniref:Phosphate transport system permease protein n=1 Tax=Fictibacillus iocasae TaxID=2715437 RepID=A0ABW2NKB1_9BACL
MERALEKAAQQTAPVQQAAVPRKTFQFNRRKMSDVAFRYFCWISVILLCMTLLSIIGFMGKTGLMTFKEVSVSEYFLSLSWLPEEGKYGAALFILGTFSLTALTLVIAVPLSIGMAIFISEVAPEWLKRIIRPMLDLLVGIPSIVYGYLGMTILIPFLRDAAGVQVGDGLLAAALVLTLMVLPTITRVSDDAITFVPQQFREAAYAMGSTRSQMITRIILPAAKQGIVSAVILGMARAIGETMAVVMVIGNTAELAKDLFTPTSVLTSNIVMQITNVEFGSAWSNALYMMAFILLFISLVMIIGIRVLQAKRSFVK